ncbi:fatty-acid amide hydrolase 2-A-like [Schistocerca serialis cubense]|uniref:fatty-acid amide hydrolase 2-A-like n=1 Tax=Schistocerca serialis cubense TaxID=2023355 RepID=UPI00214F13C5|nr:fatty-acid amide hydrolase 2-A-like [Schistocerca serialis cubense]
MAGWLAGGRARLGSRRWRTPQAGDAPYCTRERELRMLTWWSQWALRLLMLAARPVALALVRARLLFAPRRAVPPVSDPVLLAPAHQLAAAIRSGQLSSERVVRAYSERVRLVQPVVNAVVEDRLAAALEEARRVDHLLAVGAAPPPEQQPLLGVPLTVKGSFAVEGLSHACGRLTHAAVKADRDAEAVSRLREAGAIPLLVSTTPELGLCYETYEKIHGVTRNPYDTRRTPGGSSGGEAALLGSAASVVGLASDVGGSARLPALFCGVFGHKPSPGVVPHEGHIPSGSDKRWPRFFSASPMCRYAGDLPLMLHVLAGPLAPDLRLLQPVSVQSVRVLYMEDDGGGVLTDSVSRAQKDALRRAVAWLDSVRDRPAQQVHIKGLRHSVRLSAPLSMSMQLHQHPLMKADDPNDCENLALALLKMMVCRLPHNMYVFHYSFLKKWANSLPESTLRGLADEVDELRREICELLGEDGVLLYPTAPHPANVLFEQFVRFPNNAYLAVFNTLGLPATHCPAGLDPSSGMPLGLQVVAAPNQDRLCFAVARELEAGLGGWQPPAPHAGAAAAPITATGDTDSATAPAAATVIPIGS